MTNSNTQFSDLMKSFMNPEFYMSSIKNMPAMDFSAISDTIKKSSQIFTTTNQIATESLQSMFQKNSEVFQKNTADLVTSAKEAISSGDIKKITECQQKYLKSICEASISNAKEFANMASEASFKMMEAVNGVTEKMTKSCDNIKNKS
jgi:phasin family protein